MNCTLGRRPSPEAGWSVGRRQLGVKEASFEGSLLLRSGRMEGATGRDPGDGGAGLERGDALGEMGMFTGIGGCLLRNECGYQCQ